VEIAQAAGYEAAWARVLDDHWLDCIRAAAVILFRRSHELVVIIGAIPPHGRTAGVTIIYDGQCPFCARFVTMARLREAAGVVELIDARTDERGLQEARALGRDLDQGMLVRFDNQYYFGADALRVIALLSSRSNLFNKLFAALFSNSIVSTALYPLLRAGRNLVLRMLGRRKLVG
jgi:predicted DCC family thiol-disulfide oxidoreductase YuxK